MGGQQGILVAGRYHLVSESGRGGKGTVWRARDDLLDRHVAIKEVRVGPWLSEEERLSLCHRLIGEARATAALRHPGVVTVYDIVQQDGRPWIVMELVEAPSLQDLIDSEGRLSPQRAAEIGLGVLSALTAAHQAGILHRDVKPSNVLLPADGRVLLTDFGLAVRTADGYGGLPSEGSPPYVSPEQAWSGPISEASDLWSLGATLYAAVEGHAPFARSEPLASLIAVLIDDYRPPQYAGSLRPVIDGLLRRDPQERATAEETGRRLSRLARRQEQRPLYSRPVRWALTGVVTAGLAGLAAGGQRGLGNDQAEPAATTLTLQAQGALHSGGVVRHQDPAGFSVEVPGGWHRSARDGVTYWYDPVGRGSLRICRAPGDPLTGLLGAEQRAVGSGRFPGYRRLRLERPTGTGDGGAEWEFVWGRAHAMRIRIGGFDLFFATPDDRWTPSLRGYGVVAQTFRPFTPSIQRTGAGTETGAGAEAGPGAEAGTASLPCPD